jgi:Ubiquitin-activating enzyme E1 FCCH domain/Phage tail tube protein, TTP
MAAGKNLKFQGSILSVAAAKATAKAITAISKAKPAVVSSTAHGYVNGDAIYIAAVLGMTELNGGWYIVQGQTANSFELAGIDTTGYGTYTSGGTAQLAVMSTWCEIGSWAVTGGQSSEIDVTTICSNSKETETGLPDFGTIAADYNFYPKSAIQAFLSAAQLSSETVPARLVLPNGQGVLTYLLGITQISYNGAVDGIWEGSASFRIKEAPAFV